MLLNIFKNEVECVQIFKKYKEERIWKLTDEKIKAATIMTKADQSGNTEFQGLLLGTLSGKIYQITYNQQTHHFDIILKVFKKAHEITSLHPLNGTEFIVVSKNERIIGCKIKEDHSISKAFSLTSENENKLPNVKAVVGSQKKYFIFQAREGYGITLKNLV